jgi:hypothetical protein
MVLAPVTAWAGKRVALIVGNSTYQTVPQLPNPSRDAYAVAKMFRDSGFDSVELVLNVGNLEFKRAMRKFEATADQAEMALVYYAGHGLEIGATNYLIPVDARLASDRDAGDEAISLERPVSSADGARARATRVGLPNNEVNHGQLLSYEALVRGHCRDCAADALEHRAGPRRGTGHRRD